MMTTMKVKDENSKSKLGIRKEAINFTIERNTGEKQKKSKENK